MTIIEKILDKMRASKGIPSLETSVNGILAALDNDKVNNSELIKHITNDLALTQKVLKLVNSSMYATFAKDTNTISDALRILGIKTIMHLVVSTIVISSIDLHDDNEELAKILLSSELAKCITSNSEDAAIAALLYQVGKLLVSKYLNDEMKLINDKIASGQSEDSAEIEVLGMTISTVGIEVIKEWKFPKTIISILDGTGNKEIIEIAKFTNIASDMLYNNKVKDILPLISKLNISDEFKLKVMKLVKDKYENIIKKEQPIVIPTLEEITATSKIVKPLEETKPIVISKYKTTPINVGLELLISDIKSEQFTDIKDVSKFVFVNLLEILNSKHCLLLSAKTHYTHIAVYGVGNNIDEVIDKFIINLKDHPNVIQSSLTNSIDISINNISKLSSTSIPVFFKLLLPEVKRFLVLPIKNDSKNVMNAIYLDWDDLEPINPAVLVIIKKLRDEFTKYCI